MSCSRPWEDNALETLRQKYYNVSLDVCRRKNGRNFRFEFWKQLFLTTPLSFPVLLRWEGGRTISVTGLYNHITGSQSVHHIVKSMLKLLTFWKQSTIILLAAPLLNKELELKKTKQNKNNHSTPMYSHHNLENGSTLSKYLYHHSRSYLDLDIRGQNITETSNTYVCWKIFAVKTTRWKRQN